MDSDDRLIERFRGGDEEAFTAIVERHQRDVYGLAFRIAGNHEDAHDLAQEAFVRVYRSLAGFRGDASFRTWLYRIVANLSLNHLRRTRRAREGHVSLDHAVLSVAATGATNLLRDEAHEQLQAAVGKLPEKQQRTLVLKVFHELKFTEIATVMGCSVGTAKANFFHAVRRLRRELHAAGEVNPTRSRP